MLTPSSSVREQILTATCQVGIRCRDGCVRVSVGFAPFPFRLSLGLRRTVVPPTSVVEPEIERRRTASHWGNTRRTKPFSRSPDLLRAGAGLFPCNETTTRRSHHPDEDCLDFRTTGSQRSCGCSTSRGDFPLLQVPSATSPCGRGLSPRPSRCVVGRSRGSRSTV